MATKAYTLTISYQESAIGSEIISSSGDDNGLTHTQADLLRFLGYLKAISIKQDPLSFSAKVVSIVEIGE